MKATERGKVICINPERYAHFHEGRTYPFEKLRGSQGGTFYRVYLGEPQGPGTFGGEQNRLRPDVFRRMFKIVTCDRIYKRVAIKSVLLRADPGEDMQARDMSPGRIVDVSPLVAEPYDLVAIQVVAELDDDDNVLGEEQRVFVVVEGSDSFPSDMAYVGTVSFDGPFLHLLEYPLTKVAKPIGD